jgi:ubiquinone/menaquinone biosynthesis C-methylase UbiE
LASNPAHPGGRAPDFGARAADYERLRPVDDNWLEVFEVVVREADLRGARVLDVGCGTGKFGRVLAEHGIARVWGVDPSPEMLGEARRRLPSSVGLKRGSAERLPFKPAYFDAAVLWTVVHVVDRPRAFAELHRVLAPGGRLAIVTFAPEHFTGYWQNRFFPSIAPIDLARHPSPDQLEAELSAAGFEAPRLVRLRQQAELDRATALERIRGRAISTFDLLDEEEIRAGTAEAERELPKRVTYEVVYLLAFARR